MSDRYPQDDGSMSARRVRVITPADVDLTEITRAIYVGGTGNVVIRAADDTADVTLTGVPAGSILPIKARRIGASTTATGIVGLY